MLVLQAFDRRDQLIIMECALREAAEARRDRLREQGA
jgi:hypothetical protein